MKRIPAIEKIAAIAFACVACVAAVSLTGCTKMSATQEASSRGDSALTPAPATTQAPIAPGFVNRVWQVVDSTDVHTGAMFTFLSTGTLVATSSTGTPSVGEWKLSPSGLTMIEEGISYETQIVTLTPTEFRLKSHNPGGTVDIHLIPADTPPYTP